MKRFLVFEQIVDSRFEKEPLKKINSIVKKLDNILNKNSILFEHTNLQLINFVDNNFQYRVKYKIKNKANLTWNDVYKLINSVKAVPYKFNKE